MFKKFQNSKKYWYVLIFILALVVVGLLAHFVIFYLIKVAKHIWNTCSHILAENDSWFIIILPLYGSIDYSSVIFNFYSWKNQKNVHNSTTKEKSGQILKSSKFLTVLLGLWKVTFYASNLGISFTG